MEKTEQCPNREQILTKMWKLACAGDGDAIRLACVPPEEWCGMKGLDLEAVTEFKRGSSGAAELRFVDRGRLLERLLDAVDRSGEDQVDRFLQAMETRENEK